MLKRKKHADQLSGAKRDPELYILLAIMSGAFGLAGWHFSSNPTSSSSEATVHKAEGTEPWKTGGSARYEYHPHGDTSRRKEAPSALNEVIIPNVNLPKVSSGLFESQGGACGREHIWGVPQEGPIVCGEEQRLERSCRQKQCN